MIFINFFEITFSLYAYVSNVTANSEIPFKFESAFEYLRKNQVKTHE